LFKRARESGAKVGDVTDADFAAYKPYANRDKQLRELGEKGNLSKGDRVNLSGQVEDNLAIELEAEAKKNERQLRFEQAKEYAKRPSGLVKGLDSYLKKEQQDDSKDSDERVRVFDAGFSKDRSGLVSEAGQQQRISQLTLDRQPYAAAEQALNKELELADQLLAKDKQRAAFLRGEAEKELFDAQKKKLLAEAETQEAKALADRKEATRKAEQEFQIRSLEIEKQRSQEANKLGQDLFQAATSRGGFRQFYQNLGQRTATTIAGNVLEAPLRGVTSRLGSLGDSSGFGQYLKGTVFQGDKKSPEVEAHEKTRAALLETVAPSTISPRRSAARQPIPQPSPQLP